MNTKKILLVTLICIMAIATAMEIVWGIRIYQSEQYPYWQAAKEIYKVQTALQEVDEDWKLESLSEVRPFVIKGPNNVSINYYCCITSYLNEEPAETDGLNKAALDLMIDIDTLENRNDCKIGGWEGVQGELEGLTYLCWTVSPKYSCVMEYTAGTVTEEDIFHMAKSVRLIK